MKNKMITLSGKWKIIKDEENIGREAGWYKNIPDTDVQEIEVFEHIPNEKSWMLDSVYASVFPGHHGFVWYYKKIEPDIKPDARERVILEFERVAYLCCAYLNGVFVGEHAQHEQSFYFDVTDAYNPDGKNFFAVQ